MKYFYTFLGCVIFSCISFPAQALWIQYDLATGVQTGSNSVQVNPADLAALGHGQVEYKGGSIIDGITVDVSKPANPAMLYHPPPGLNYVNPPDNSSSGGVAVTPGT